MILKGEKYKYKVNFVKKGKAQNGNEYVRFSVGDYNPRTKQTGYLQVMVHGALDIIDGDMISFLDYLVGANKHTNGMTYFNVYAKPENIVIQTVSDDGLNVEDLNEDTDLPF